MMGTVITNIFEQIVNQFNFIKFHRLRKIHKIYTH